MGAHHPISPYLVPCTSSECVLHNKTVFENPELSELSEVSRKLLILRGGYSDMQVCSGQAEVGVPWTSVGNVEVPQSGSSPDTHCVCVMR